MTNGWSRSIELMIIDLVETCYTKILIIGSTYLPATFPAFDLQQFSRVQAWEHNKQLIKKESQKRTPCSDGDAVGIKLRSV